MNLTFTEAPHGVPLDGLIDPVDLPYSIRVIARPDARTTFPFALDVLTDLGHGRSAPGKGRASGTRMTLASAWALTHHIRTIYVGEAQELTPTLTEEIIDFAARVGSSLCFIFGYGQVHTRVSLLRRRGGSFRDYRDLPAAITTPMPPVQAAPSQDPETAARDMALPGDNWMTFRSAYLEMLDPKEAKRCDDIYRATMTTVAEHSPQTVDDLCQCLSEVWALEHCSRRHRIVAVRAAQAEMFRQGWNVKVEFNSIERYVSDRYLNPLRPHHYRDLEAFCEPWRSAATALHAHHVPTEQMLTLRAQAVSADGLIHDLEVVEAAKPLIAAQRWVQLIGSPDEDPPLFDCPQAALRAGIRRVVAELNLPLVPRWRRPDDRRYETRTGLTLDRI